MVENESCVPSLLKQLSVQSAALQVGLSERSVRKWMARFRAEGVGVIGKRDMEADAVTVRVHDKGNLRAKPRGEVIADLLRAVAARSA